MKDSSNKEKKQREPKSFRLWKKEYNNETYNVKSFRLWMKKDETEDDEDELEESENENEVEDDEDDE